MNQTVVIKSNKYGLVVVLDQTISFEELCRDVALKFKESEKFFRNAQMAITFEGRELSRDEEVALLQVISDNCSIHIICLIDQDTWKEELMKHTIEQHQIQMNAQDGKFYKGTLRSGQVLESETSIIILGDVNPGAKVFSKGNVIVLGCLKGNIHAGAAGNENAFVAALSMYPMQIRIGDVIARSEDKPLKRGSDVPKIAFVEDGNIYMEPISKEVLSDIRL